MILLFRYGGPSAEVSEDIATDSSAMRPADLTACSNVWFILTLRSRKLIGYSEAGLVERGKLTSWRHS
jgi:hypothetical protein